MPGSGKEEFIRVAKEKGYSVVRMGDVVREWVKKKELDMDDGSVGGFAHSEREKHHYGIWAERTLKKIQVQKTIIDGLRGDEELEIFRKKLGHDLVVVAVYASPKTRYNRLVARARQDAPGSYTEFKERDRRELRWGLGEVIALADHTIVNEGSLEEFRVKADRLLEDL